MPVRLYYTINASLLVERNKDSFNIENAKLNVFVNKETDFSPPLYKVLASLESEYIVSLSASLLQDRSVLPGLLAKLYLLVVLNQSSTGKKIMPIFSNVGDQEPSLNIEKIQTYLNQQGLCDLKLPVFDYSANGIQTIDNCSLFVMPGQSTDLPGDLSKNNEYGTTMIIASREEITDLTVIADLNKQIISDNNNLNTDISPFSIEKEEFEIERELWKKRTLLYQEFLSLGKKVQEKEYHDIVNWYHQEYEILPLWYKRFGHILKVLLGKRTFKSLYRDDVKKYKD